MPSGGGASSTRKAGSVVPVNVAPDEPPNNMRWLREKPVLLARATTGIKAQPLGVINVDTLIVYDEMGEVKYHYVLVDVLYRNPEGIARPGGDALEVGFYRLEDALKMDLTKSVKGLLEKIVLNLTPLEKPISHRTYRYVE